jgi:hypothetical protein
VDLFLAISQGTGLALATGVRPFLPPLLAGALARADAGVNFSGTDFAFLESAPFLAALVVLAAVGTIATGATSKLPLARAVGAIAVILGALLFAGSLAEEDYAGGPGLVAGAAVATLGFVTAAAFLQGASGRLAARGEPGPARLLALYADAAAVLIALVAVFVSPIAMIPLAACGWLLVAQRRRSARKYEGLRVLR